MKPKSVANRSFAFWLSALLLAALAAASFTPAFAKNPTTVSVAGTAKWVNSRIKLVAGQEVTIQAKGTASTLKGSPLSQSGPNGQKKTSCGKLADAPPPCAMNYAPYGALVGKIGSSGVPFLIGKRSTFTAKTSGLLYLAVNDNLRWYSDNSGAFKVTITLP